MIEKALQYIIGEHGEKFTYEIVTTPDGKIYKAKVQWNRTPEEVTSDMLLLDGVNADGHRMKVYVSEWIELEN